MPKIAAENFVQLGSRNSSDLAALDHALAYIGTSQYGTQVLSELIDKKAAVFINHDGNNSWRSDGVIFWDPGKGLATVKDNGEPGGMISAALAFLHEAAHHIDEATYDPATWGNIQWNNDQERFAGQIEAAVAAELGEPARENHEGITLVDVDNPTLHTRENEDGTFTWTQVDVLGDVQVGPAWDGNPYSPAPQFGDGPPDVSGPPENEEPTQDDPSDEYDGPLLGDASDPPSTGSPIGGGGGPDDDEEKDEDDDETAPTVVTPGNELDLIAMFGGNQDAPVDLPSVDGGNGIVVLIGMPDAESPALF